jgi:hypothetical protein
MDALVVYGYGSYLHDCGMAALARCGHTVLRGLRKDTFLAAAMDVSGSRNVFHYNGGSYSRESRGEGLVDVGYTNPENELLVHNEMAYVRDYPAHIAFYCDKKAVTGGETLLCDGQKVWADLSAGAQKLLQEQKLTYSQIYGNGDLQYKSMNDYMALWQDVFDVSDKASAHAAAAKLGYQVNWLAEDEMEVCFTRPAIMIKEDNDGSSIVSMFDQIVCCHSKNCHAETRDGRPQFHVTLASDKADSDSTDSYSKNTPTAPSVRTELPASFMEEMEFLTKKHTEVVELNEGDAVVVDNIRVKHGRSPFTGEREMIVALLA